jgi:hypothetical protein
MVKASAYQKPLRIHFIGGHIVDCKIVGLGGMNNATEAGKHPTHHHDWRKILTADGRELEIDLLDVESIEVLSPTDSASARESDG